MKRYLSIVFMSVAAALVAASPTASGPALDASQKQGEWQPLFDALVVRTPTAATFTETREFPFRKKPVVLHGDMRIDPVRGLSLHYQQPEERTLIADSKGLLQRDARGGERAVLADPQVAAFTAAILPVLRFDLFQIEKQFVIHGVRDGADWRLDFLPRTPEATRALGRLIVRGREQVVHTIELVRGPRQRVEIAIDHVQRLDAFDAADLKRFFR